MATEIRLKKEDIKLVINFGSRVSDTSAGVVYYHLPDWFALDDGKDYVRRLFLDDLPEWARDFAKTPSENKKDQQIKDLTVMVESFDNLISFIDSAYKDGLDLKNGLTLSDAWIKYNIAKQLYERKYLTK